MLQAYLPPRFFPTLLGIACLALAAYWWWTERTLSLWTCAIAGMGTYSLFMRVQDPQESKSRALQEREEQLAAFSGQHRETVKARVDDFERSEVQRSVSLGRYYAIGLTILMVLS